MTDVEEPEKIDVEVKPEESETPDKSKWGMMCIVAEEFCMLMFTSMSPNYFSQRMLHNISSCIASNSPVTLTLVYKC